ncbi:ATP-binding cassette multidrug transporter PDR5 [Sugiyamaella lignohabitans]|uniref:ATP-binding cassette multidrug transporter PDR5 n=1 Tax=Sugiyamaella lignohabitans TaxID=796027 RepID=A0A161HI40_9ASCO|nr:ATP-binding cassette multidrug transporter PDR5 [Sugiyamaella lignohabitans]ANB15900.1 ATP-binding cassette multidrug transporter PDR5 [Sugiyamaella lignohabitans]
MSEFSEKNPNAYDGRLESGHIQELARQLTRQSHHKEEVLDLVRTYSKKVPSESNSFPNGPVNPFDAGAEDSELDPNSDHFNSVAWAKNMYQIFQSDPDRYKQRELGFAYKDLHAYGYGTDADFQATVYNTFLKAGTFVYNAATGFRNRVHVDILQSMDGLVLPSEMVVVLGRPGAGCSTFLKTVAQQTYGFHIDDTSIINYNGISPQDIKTNFRGDVIYSAESETHFPHLTVGQTLLFAAKMRTPHNRIPGVSRLDHATHMRDMVMATFGLSHTVDTKVGSDLVRGVSGGERKRVSIAEVALSGAPLQCWDNSTRGLDSATALEFIRSLKTSATIFKNTSLVAVYQSSEEMYDLFDKVILLYEGHQIFFGKREHAKQFFYDMGFDSKPRQPTPDFLTSLTSPSERIVRPGFENKVPRTPAEFGARWRASNLYAELRNEIDEYIRENPEHGENYEAFKESHTASQAKRLPHRSPYTVSFGDQIKYLIGRGYERIMGDFSMQFTTIFGNTSMGLIMSSMFYNLPSDTSSFYRRSSLLFFAILFNAFASFLEIFSLFEARPIVEKHKQFALYHPAADALASILTEFPSKVLVAIAFNLVIYFMSNLRRTPGHFFTFLVVGFSTTISMSHLFRTVGSLSTSLQEAMIPATILLMALVIYTGFVIPTDYMHGWARWLNYINPVGYGFEALMANEFSGKNYTCDVFVPTGPTYTDLEPKGFVCSGAGSVPGEKFINGDAYIETSFKYFRSHLWRNFGIVLAFSAFFLFTYLLGVWVNPGMRSKGELLVFQRSTLKKLKKERKVRIAQSSDEESGRSAVAKESFLTEGEESAASSNNSAINAAVETSNDIFYWKDVCYDIKIKGKERRILDHVDGWVKPGTLTALMGASGAGKTTLLDTLANRVTMGVVTGEMFVNGNPRDESFQRSTGYAQQQDLHLETATVREALEFSAILRQPKEVPREEKIAYVDVVLKILEMEDYADAVVGVPGEGLNVEQRKRLTIGVELAAKPKLLLFLDEPTSGLDSQTAWSVCQLMKKLSNAGQAILCTIHQPSAMLLQEFDRLLFLARGGKTVYFGEIGENSKTLTGYFERNGADPCPPEANPAEWMLHVIGAAPGSVANADYSEIWNASPERAAIREEIERMKSDFGVQENAMSLPSQHTGEFASGLWLQYRVVTKRVLEQYWRTPSYIWSKLGLAIFSALFNGFSFFKAGNTLQGMQNLMFSCFMFLMIFNSGIQQMIPFWVKQRDLYEARERPAKIFSWKAFVAAQVTAEVPWQILAGTISFFCWYYPIGFYRNAAYTDAVHSRGASMYIYVVGFFIYISTMGQMCIAGVDLGETAANIGSLLFTMCLIFSGVLSSKSTLNFWIYQYYVNPLQFLISGMLAIGIGKSPVRCAENEYVLVDAPQGQTCGSYLADYQSAAGGYINNPNDTVGCQFCSIASTDAYLASVDIEFGQRWRNFGIFFSFIAFNVIMTFFFYWLARVPKRKDRVKKQ